MVAQLILNSGREKSLLRKHPWVFSRAINKVTGKPKSGETVEVRTDKGDFIALAAYSPESQIRARVWSFEQDQKIDQAFFTNLLSEAKQRKESLVLEHSNGYRLIAGESDGLPGITIDNFAGTLVVQLLSAGAEYHRDSIVECLLSVFPNAPIYERSDVDVRKKEGLAPQKGWLANAQEIKFGQHH